MSHKQRFALETHLTCHRLVAAKPFTAQQGCRKLFEEFLFITRSTLFLRTKTDH